MDEVFQIIQDPPVYEHIILAGYQWQSYAEALDARYATRATFSIVDAGIEQPLSSFQGIMFAEDQLGFLAGVVAGLFTRTKRVGVVPGIPIKVIWRFRNGYLKGVHHSCPDCDTYGDYVPSFTNSALGIQAAQKLLQQGVDVIFGAAGGTGSAAIYWAATSGTRVIGVDADESLSTFSNRSNPVTAAARANLLTSARKRLDLAVYGTMQDRYEKKFVASNKLYDVSLSGVDLAPCIPEVCELYNYSTVESTPSATGCPVTSIVSKQLYIDHVLAKFRTSTLTTGVVYDTGELVELSVDAIDKWKSLTPFGERPRNLISHSFTSVTGNRMIVFGGSRDGVVSGDTYQLDFDNYEWRRIDTTAGQPSPRYSHVAVGWKDSVVIHGGLDAKNNVLDDIWLYNSTTAQWSFLQNSTVHRARHAAAIVGETAYLYGGLTESNVLRGDLVTVDIPSMTVKPIIASGDIPPPLENAALVALEARLILFGGHIRDLGKFSNAISYFDVKLSRWSSAPANTSEGDDVLVAPALSSAKGAAVDNGRVVFTGGYNKAGISDLTMIWNVNLNVWTDLYSMRLPTNAHSHGLVVFKQAPDSCKYSEIPVLTVCIPKIKTTLLMFGGVSSAANSSSNSPLYMTYLSEASADRMDCPAGSEYQSHSGRCAVCQAGYYNLVDNSNCLPCPYGAICAGGTQILAQPGFWFNSEDPLDPRFNRCGTPNCCQDAAGCRAENTCKPGFTGTLCGSCENPEFYVWANQCAECKGISWGYITGGVFVALAFIAFEVLFPSQSMCFAELLFYYQVCGLILDSSGVSPVNTLLGMVRIDPDVSISMLTAKDGNTDFCLLPINQLGKAVLFLAAPLAMIGTVVLGMRIARVTHRARLFEALGFQKAGRFVPAFLKSRTKHDVESGLVAIIFFTIVPGIIAAAAILDCQLAGDQGHYLRRYPGAKCFTPEHIVAASFAATILFVLGIVFPFFIYWRLRKIFSNRSSTTSMDFHRYRTLFIFYRGKFYMWCLVDLFRRFAFVVASVLFVHNDMEYMQAIFGVSMILMFLTFCKPYISEMDNFMYFAVTLATLSMTSLRLVMLLPSSTEEERALFSRWQVVMLLVPCVLPAINVVILYRKRHQVETIGQRTSKLRASDIMARTVPDSGPLCRTATIDQNV